MLFLAALAWKLMARGNDRLAGAALACLTTKPQLAAVLVLLLLIWSARQRRWGVVLGFAATLAALALLGAWIVPNWPIEMLRAAGRTPPPTTYFPWIGTTWLLALKAAGLHSWGLWGLYLAVALPFLAVLLRAALDRARPLEDILSLGLIAPFILAPYGRHYDFPVLLIPMIVLIGRRLSELASTALLVTLVVLPYINLGIIVAVPGALPEYGPALPGVDLPLDSLGGDRDLVRDRAPGDPQSRFGPRQFLGRSRLAAIDCSGGDCEFIPLSERGEFEGYSHRLWRVRNPIVKRSGFSVSYYTGIAVGGQRRQRYTQGN